ncbi:unnamed protein product [Trichogramma brassicae]|uniref:Uncharacterized protein n=1 Tax=Trichogramma brassicae TaxID=86971 RepID=A0A6H5IS31_9HYME|nr:unnamed protein product [Trichogramma brassicae]
MEAPSHTNLLRRGICVKMNVNDPFSRNDVIMRKLNISLKSECKYGKYYSARLTVHESQRANDNGKHAADRCGRRAVQASTHCHSENTSRRNASQIPCVGSVYSHPSHVKTNG